MSDVSQTAKQNASQADLLENAHETFTNLEEGVWDWDLRSNDCYLSDKWWSNLGYNPSEMTSSIDAVFDIIHPEDVAHVNEVTEHAKQSDCSAYEVELRLRARDGTYRWTVARGRVQRDDTGLALRIVGINTDTTKERLLIADLERKKEFNYRLINSSVDGIFAFDTQCRLTAYNPAMERMWGYTRAQVLGQEAFALFAFLRQSHEDCLFYEALAGRSKVSRERPYEHVQTGHRGQYEAQYVPLFEADGKVSGGLVVVREISAEVERAKAHKVLLEAGSALHQSTEMPELLERIAKLAVEGLCEWCIVFVGSPGDASNDASERQNVICGAHKDEILSLRLKNWLFHRDVDLNFFTKAAPADTNPLATISQEFNLLADAPVNAKKKAFEMQLGEELGLRNFVRIPLLVRDVHLGSLIMGHQSQTIESTMLLSIELFCHRAALALDNAMLFVKTKETRSARERVIRAVSRELSAPLKSIETLSAAALETLKQNKCQDVRELAQPSSDALAQMSNNFSRYALRMKSLITKILDVSTLDGGQFTIKTESVDTRALCDEVAEAFRQIADERNITISCTCAADIANVRGDKERLLQVLGNLIDNAIKFSGENSRISLCAARDGEKITFRICDEGPGIAAEQQSSLFERMWQAPGDRHQGTGLGLYIASGLVRAHGGKIFLESETDEQKHGTCFVVELDAYH